MDPTHIIPQNDHLNANFKLIFQEYLSPSPSGEELSRGNDIRTILGGALSSLTCFGTFGKLGMSGSTIDIDAPC